MIVLGTSGYHFGDWAGPFYPPALPKEQWLRYYAERFPVVEINSTYYGLPRPDSVVRWNREVPDRFGFFVKLHGDSTHTRENRGEEVSELLTLLGPLREGGQLRGLLAQFPASFHRTEQGERYLAELARRCEDVPLFVEFRHRSWDHDDAVALCRELSLNWVAVDAPPISSLMPARPAVTGPAGYVRFHGRNAATWYHPERGDRYDWDYTARELEAWLPRLHAMENRAEVVYLFFNNCHAGQAIKSAMLMRELLRRQGDFEDIA